MVTVSSEEDASRCRNLWERNVAVEQLTDLWEVRNCFHQFYQRSPLFVVARENDETVGLIPLSFIPEKKYYGCFPGEVWQGKTWLEQNRVFARDEQTFQRMLDWMDSRGIAYYLRYLHANKAFPAHFASEDEIGYLFHPPEFQYDVERYYLTFNRKSIKTVWKDVDKLKARGLEFADGGEEDFQRMVRLNIERFGEHSYFADERFSKSFFALKDLLKDRGWLRITTARVEGEVAAVDMGCVFNGAYTLLAGGTDNRFLGVAKAINLFHMQEACRLKFQEVDFLCGDFVWKKNFHLKPRPLFKASNIQLELSQGQGAGCHHV